MEVVTAVGRVQPHTRPHLLHFQVRKHHLYYNSRVDVNLTLSDDKSTTPTILRNKKGDVPRFSYFLVWCGVLIIITPSELFSRERCKSILLLWYCSFLDLLPRRIRLSEKIHVFKVEKVISSVYFWGLILLHWYMSVFTSTNMVHYSLRAYVYVYVCLIVYVCMCVCMYIRIYICTYVWLLVTSTDLKINSTQLLFCLHWWQSNWW